MQVRPALKPITVQENVSAHLGFGSTDDSGGAIAGQRGSQSHGVRVVGHLTDFQCELCWGFTACYTSFNCILSAGNCTEYHHSVQVTRNIRHNPLLPYASAHYKPAKIYT